MYYCSGRMGYNFRIYFLIYFVILTSFYIVVNIKHSKPFTTILYKKLICMHNFLDKMEGIGYCGRIRRVHQNNPQCLK